ncbi:hypothetical protein C1646_776207 [Rhizophagus diaphanus]|nr:hypothetical protein C1646_776207 [Rhizophagus diaphanus] [Rhizophagus sp. MUCL 43196]
MSEYIEFKSKIFEIKEEDEDLFIGSTVCQMWWQIVRREVYKRWKNYATTIGSVQALGKPFEKENIDWITFEYMLRNGMVIDFQERQIIEYALSEHKWGGDPWGLDWK